MSSSRSGAVDGLITIRIFAPFRPRPERRALSPGRAPSVSMSAFAPGARVAGGFRRLETGGERVDVVLGQLPGRLLEHRDEVGDLLGLGGEADVAARPVAGDGQLAGGGVHDAEPGDAALVAAEA